MSEKHIVVIGGSAAGPKAAARARRLDPEARITIIQKEADFSMASCGYPYYVGGVFDNRNDLIATPTGVVRDSNFFLKAKGIEAIQRTEALGIDREKHTVTCQRLDGDEKFEVSYDKLILATGSSAFVPPIPGADLEGVTTLKSLQDADYLRQVRDEGKVKKAAIVGGGLIGLETMEALELAGIELTLIEMLPQIMLSLDWDLAALLENYVKTRANVITQNRVTEFLGKDGKVHAVKLENGTELPCELVVVAVGVRPETRLAGEAGLTLGNSGGILVNEYMQTDDPDIYAAGDCIEVKNQITDKHHPAPFGDLANLEGRVAAQNAINGNSATFPGTIQTGICKVWDWSAGATGLNTQRAIDAGFTDTTSVICAGPDKPHFMGGKLLIIRMIADNKTGRVLGVQATGPGDASTRIAIAATAIQAGMTVEDMTNLDLPYAPPFSPALDPIITTAHALQNKMAGMMTGITPREVREKMDDGEKPYLLDVRGPDEYEAMRLGIGEVLIPLGALRGRINEMPEDKNAEIICYCKISLRGYEAARVLQGHGYTNVKVMEGGVMCWPYPREK